MAKSFLSLLLMAMVATAVSAFGGYSPVLKAPSSVSERLHDDVTAVVVV